MQDGDRITLRFCSTQAAVPEAERPLLAGGALRRAPSSESPTKFVGHGFTVLLTTADCHGRHQCRHAFGTERIKVHGRRSLDSGVSAPVATMYTLNLAECELFLKFSDSNARSLRVERVGDRGGNRGGNRGG